MSKYSYNELHQNGGKLQKLPPSSNTFHNAILHIFLSLSFFGQQASISQYFSKSTSSALKFGSKLHTEYLYCLKYKAFIKTQEVAALIGFINRFLSFAFNFMKMQAFYYV